VTATPATPATFPVEQAGNPLNVASVATVAVAEKPVPISELTLDEESHIRAWLAYIDETDPATIADVLNDCQKDREARQYFLKRSEEVPEPVTANRSVRCGD